MIAGSREDDLLNKLKSCVGGVTANAPTPQNRVSSSLAPSFRQSTSNYQRATADVMPKKEPVSNYNTRQ